METGIKRRSTWESLNAFDPNNDYLLCLFRTGTSIILININSNENNSLFFDKTFESITYEIAQTNHCVCGHCWTVSLFSRSRTKLITFHRCQDWNQHAKFNSNVIPFNHRISRLMCCVLRCWNVFVVFFRFVPPLSHFSRMTNTPWTLNSNRYSR